MKLSHANILRNVWARGVLAVGPLLAAQPAPVIVNDYPLIEPRGYVCYRAGKPPVIDGKLDDPAWSEVPWSEDFVDIEGLHKPRPKQRTRMKMLWDDDQLWIAAQIDETHVWGTLTRHDAIIFQDNDFEVFIDADADNHLYAELEVNARNTTWDLLLNKPYKSGGRGLDSWEIAGLRTAVWVDGTLNDPRDVDRGWSVEIAWPWKSLKEINRCPVPPRDGDVWRINFSRVEWDHEIAGKRYRKIKDRREHNWVWSPQGVVDMHQPERWGLVQFSTARPGTVKARPDPNAAVRHLLHRVLAAQRDYHAARGQYTSRLTDLGLKGAQWEPVRLETTASSFEATVSMPGSDGRPKHWHINSDARIWVVPSMWKQP